MVESPVPDAAPVPEPVQQEAAPPSVSVSQRASPAPSNASPTMATQLADNIPRPSESAIQVGINLPNQPALETSYTPRTRDDALRNDEYYLALMAQRILVRHALVQDPKMLGLYSASSELHLTTQEREDMINQLRL